VRMLQGMRRGTSVVDLRALFHDGGAWKAALDGALGGTWGSSDADGTGGDNHGLKKDGVWQAASRDRS
jgi:hypothetical protein